MSLKINEVTEIKINNFQDREIRFRLEKLTHEADDARKQYENLGLVSESYYILDYLIKDATALRNFIKQQKLI